MSVPSQPSSSHIIPLVDGTDIPTFGLAAFRDNDERVVKETVTRFLEVTRDQPIKHVEISELFGNGAVVVDVLYRAGLQRSEIYLTYKIWPKLRKGRDIITSCTEALELIDASYPRTYFDLVLVHAPIDIPNKFDQWTAVEALKENGFTKSIGVCCYNEDLMVDLMKNCGSQPVVCESEVTPFGQDYKFVEYCVDSSIVMLVNNVQAKQVKFNSPKFNETAASLGLTPLELHIQWILSKGFAIMLTSRELQEMDQDLSLPLTLVDKKILSSLDELEEGIKTSAEFKTPKEDT